MGALIQFRHVVSSDWITFLLNSNSGSCVSNVIQLHVNKFASWIKVCEITLEIFLLVVVVVVIIIA